MTHDFQEDGHEVFDVEGTPEECYEKIFGHVYDKFNDKFKKILAHQDVAQDFDEIMSYVLLNWVNAACKDKGGINYRRENEV